MDKNEAQRLFNAWYVKPLAVLKKEVAADAGWIALMVIFPLYERFLSAKVSKAGQGITKITLVAVDLRLTEEEADVFWKLMRHGLLHQGMPKLLDLRSGRSLGYAVYMRTDLGLPKFGERNGKPTLFFNPWVLTEYLLDLIQQQDYPQWIIDSKEFPWAWIEVTDVEAAHTTEDHSTNWSQSIHLSPHPSPPNFNASGGTITIAGTPSLGDL
jgi:hypothetical protein